jgi:hypothetical protein
MLKQRVRSILTGLALVAVLTAAIPVSSEAAGLAPATRGGDMVSLVWEWLIDLFGVSGSGGTSDLRTVSAADSTTGTGGGTATTSGTTGVCGGDQGVCIDPNG